MNPERLIGLHEEDAEHLADHYNYSVRVTNRDGQYYIVTADYRLDRINIGITDGIVTSANIG